MRCLTATGEELLAAGYVFLSQFMPELPPQVAINMLGRIETVEGLAEVQFLAPRLIGDSTPNTYSGNFGTGEFPLHTDLAHWATPPRFVVLRCLSGTNSVATSVLHSQDAVRSVGSEGMRMALVQPRRPLRNGKHLLRLLERPDAAEAERIRWDPVFLKPANGFAEAVLAAMRDTLHRSQPLQFLLREPGDTLLLDNWRVLHGRSAVSAEGLQRVIARAYLEMVH